MSKAHGHDDISVRMVKICDDSIKKPLPIIYKNCIKTSIYTNAWKKYNIASVLKKGDKQVVNNYRPVSLLPIFGKVFEKILFNSIFEYLQENCLLCDNQSVFDLLIHVSIDYFSLFMIFMHLLIVTHPKM